MTEPAIQGTAAIVLAAGRGTRFGGAKMLAELDGRPILQHVLDLAAVANLHPVVVVLAADAKAVHAAMSWRDEFVTPNDELERGISYSLQLGIRALLESGVARTLVLLGDQPRLSADQLRPILACPLDAARPIVVPCYDGRPGNPVLLERAAWPLAHQLTGDLGMSQLFASRPDLVRHVDIEGENPGVDTPADLAALSRAGGPARSDRTAGEGRHRP